jgi:drug/metabolite transporter (DMT)-like permease
MTSTNQVLEPSIAPIANEKSISEQIVSRSSSLTCRWEIAFVGAALLVVCGHLLIKAGLNTLSTLPATGISLKLAAILHEPTVWLGLGIYGLGTLCWMAAVAQTELSLLYPLTSLNYVLVACLSYVLFSESISWRRGIGIAVIALGMVLLTSQQRRQGKSS